MPSEKFNLTTADYRSDFDFIFIIANYNLKCRLDEHMIKGALGVAAKLITYKPLPTPSDV